MPCFYWQILTVYYHDFRRFQKISAHKLEIYMKQALRKDLEPVTNSFAVHELTEPYFDPNWHFHPHYQLFLVEEGTGTRFIGDSIRPFWGRSGYAWPQFTTPLAKRQGVF